VDRKRDSKNLPHPPKQAGNEAPGLPEDLAEIVAVWPGLSQHIKAAVKALVQAHKLENYHD